MEKEMPLKQIIDAALSKIGSVADVNTVIGSPIELAGGITVIPFSKVTVGFASGGIDYDSKKAPESDPHFAGGNGAGVAVTPLGFIVVENGQVRILDLKHTESFVPADDPVSKVIGAINSVIDQAPVIIEKVKNAIPKKDKSDASDATDEQ